MSRRHGGPSKRGGGQVRSNTILSAKFKIHFSKSKKFGATMKA